MDKKDTNAPDFLGSADRFLPMTDEAATLTDRKRSPAIPVMMMRKRNVSTFLLPHGGTREELEDVEVQGGAFDGEISSLL